MYLTAVVVGLY